MAALATCCDETRPDVRGRRSGRGSEKVGWVGRSAMVSGSMSILEAAGAFLRCPGYCGTPLELEAFFTPPRVPAHTLHNRLPRVFPALPFSSCNG